MMTSMAMATCLIQSTITTETGSVTLTSEGNDIQFTDDGDVTTTSGRIDLTAGATDDSGNVTQAAGSVLDAGDDEITITAHGQITLGQLKTTNTSDQAVTLTADQGIDSADPGNVLNIDAAQGRLIIRTESGVEPIRTQVDSLELANLATGSVTINEADALDVIQLDQDANAGIDLTAGGTLTIVAGRTRRDRHRLSCEFDHHRGGLRSRHQFNCAEYHWQDHHQCS